MRILKPLRLGCLHRPYRFRQQNYLGVTVFAYLDFSNENRFLFRTEQEMWNFYNDVAFKDFGAELLDMSIPKKQPEILVSGYGFGKYAVEGRTAVQIKVGNVKKDLWVTGDRVWEGRHPSKPKDFERIPISWKNAFGGPNFPSNPHGKGFASLTDKVLGSIPLPNIEDPHNPVIKKNEHYEAVSFSMLPLEYEGRNKLLGTYDEKWLKEDFPGFADDIDWSYFNSAPKDQRLASLEIGDEITFTNLHPDKATLVTSIPPVKIRFFYGYDESSEYFNGNKLEEGNLSLAGYWGFPSAEKAILIFQGKIEIVEDDAEDLKYMFFALEESGDSKPISYYNEVFKLRTDDKVGGLYSLLDSQLMPRKFMAPADYETIKISKLLHNKLNRAHKDLERQKKLLLDTLQLSEDELQQLILGEEEIDEITKQQYLELTKLSEDIIKKQKHPDFEENVLRQIALIKEQQETSKYKSKRKKLMTQLNQGKEEFNDSLNELEQHDEENVFLQTFSLNEELSFERELRPGSECEQELIKEMNTLIQKRNQESFESLEKMSSNSSFYSNEKTNKLNQIKTNFDVVMTTKLKDGDYYLVANEQISNGDFFEHNICRASEIVDSHFTNCNFQKVNFNESEFINCIFTNCVLDSSNLSGAKFVDCRFVDCSINNVQCFKTKVLGTEFNNSTLKNWLTSKLIFDDINIVDSHLENLLYERSTVKNITYENTEILRVGHVKGRVENISFRNCKVESFGFVSIKNILSLNIIESEIGKFFLHAKSNLKDLHIEKSNISDSSFRDVLLENSFISDSTLRRNDFSKTVFFRINVEDTHFRESLFIRSVFDSSKFKRADFGLTFLKHSNFNDCIFNQCSFFSADMAGAQRNEKTIFEKCLFDRVNFLPRKNEGLMI